MKLKFGIMSEKLLAVLNRFIESNVGIRRAGAEWEGAGISRHKDEDGKSVTRRQDTDIVKGGLGGQNWKEVEDVKQERALVCACER
jgi:hypothetical protein